MSENMDFTLFQRLTRIFSRPLVRSSFNNTLKLKRRYYNKFNFQTTPWNYSVFANIQRSNDRWFDRIYQDSLSNQDRVLRYREFEIMETMPEIARALEIYADECTVSTRMQDILDIDSSNTYIKDILWRLFYDTLDVKSNLWGWTKQMCKYGDYYLLLYLDANNGVTHTMGLPEKEILRLEGLDPNNPDYVKFRWETENIDFENFQVVHFRLGWNDKYFPYGVSLLEPARRIYRQLSMQEDVMMAYRIARSPERRVFYIDQEGVPPEMQEAYLEKIRSNLRSNQVVNHDSGEIYKRYNAWSIEDDIFIPKRGANDTTRIESLPGGQYVGVIDDIKYLRNKLFTALGVPSSYLEDKEGAEDKESLAQKDVRFAATVCRIQSYVVAALEKIAQVHLAILGFSGEDIMNFSLKLNNPSKIWENQELEFWRTKLDLASAAENKLSRQYVFKKFFGFTDDEIRINLMQLFGDTKFMASLEVAKAMYTNAASGQQMGAGGGGIGGGMGGGLGGGLGGDLGGGLGGMMGDLGGGSMGGGDMGGGLDLEGGLGGETGGGLGGGEAPSGGEGGGEGLKVVPGRHKEDSERARGTSHRTKGAHSDYSPVLKDKRREGAKKRSKKSKVTIGTFNKPQNHLMHNMIFESEDDDMSTRSLEILESIDYILESLENGEKKWGGK